ncbi:MAG: Cof-type HAD-IIB family hydrolase [Finegoldia magna]|uniref:Cof-type HAD-IIB family hydrolase n=1 Tax=Finegoldia magna TaxID=1260 RepID=UPI002904B781|nr:Cof-type HAD-IIB family hydrolase [Finegoldia magna]MDU1832374.1 Cof-type HAD-IIB family hydrolase [Finegoldia magna]MDU1878473.1 Cof-type HAD-IIB family hydrolase [Finegoldia magna]MDU5224192.1 Cof-type HAD-IIB family hydrolase [Finegoldia magna]MDU5237092.1 Cof-type HAD-IIB family hydrolase [Finegoldia magna]
MKNNFKAVMIDLDGTLLTDDKKITDFSYQILQNLYNKGIKIIIATGRGLSRAKQLTEKLDFDKIILANNGAIIHSSSNIAMDEDLMLDSNVVDKLSALSKEYGIRPYFFVENKCSLLIQDEDDKKYYVDSVGDESEIMTISERNLPINDCVSMIMISAKNNILKMVDIIKNNPHVTYHIHTKYFPQNIRMLEVQNVNTDKYKRAIALLEHFGIKNDEVVAIGDAHNDLEMVVNSGLGVAMKNSDDILKQQADIITQYTNEEDGLAKFLEELFELRDYE